MNKNKNLDGLVPATLISMLFLSFLVIYTVYLAQENIIDSIEQKPVCEVVSKEKEKPLKVSPEMIMDIEVVDYMTIQKFDDKWEGTVKFNDGYRFETAYKDYWSLLFKLYNVSAHKNNN